MKIISTITVIFSLLAFNIFSMKEDITPSDVNHLLSLKWKQDSKTSVLGSCKYANIFSSTFTSVSTSAPIVIKTYNTPIFTLHNEYFTEHVDSITEVCIPGSKYILNGFAAMWIGMCVGGVLTKAQMKKIDGHICDKLLDSMRKEWNQLDTSYKIDVLKYSYEFFKHYDWYPKLVATIKDIVKTTSPSIAKS